MNAESWLVEWTERLVRHRDMLRKEIISIKKEGNTLAAEKKAGTEIYIIDPLLDSCQEWVSRASSSASKFTVVCLNSEESFKKLTERWEECASLSNLAVIFVNPFSSTDTKWIIKPYVHSRIAEPESLAQGLRTLFESVEPITKEEFVRRISE